MTSQQQCRFVLCKNCVPLIKLRIRQHEKREQEFLKSNSLEQAENNRRLAVYLKELLEGIEAT